MPLLLTFCLSSVMCTPHFTIVLLLLFCSVKNLFPFYTVGLSDVTEKTKPNVKILAIIDSD